MSHLCYRVLSERYLTSEIDIVKWNPKYDLLGIATKRGDVILQRLFWKKAWQISLSSIFDNDNGGIDIAISNLTWSPNGKHLAIIYSTGKVIYVEIESGRICYEITDDSDSASARHSRAVLISRWAESKLPDSCINYENDDLFLPLPPLEKSKAATSNASLPNSIGLELFPIGFQPDKNGCLTLFIISDGRGHLRLFLNGFFNMANLQLSTLLSTTEENGRVIPVAVDVSADLDRIGLVYCDADSVLRFAVFETPLSAKTTGFWARLSQRVSEVLHSQRYIETAMQKISDSWEETLTDLDVKLTKYAWSKGSSAETIGDDFIQMLVFGTASPELEHFMTHTLTDKGLKKISSSLENCYQNLLNLLGMNLDSSISALYHQLTTLQSLASNDDKPVWTEAMETVAALALKITRIHDVVESNVRSVGLFIRWLHRCLLTVTEENLPPNLSKFSDEDVDAVAQFIQDHFCQTVWKPCEDGDAPSAVFHLEKFGQFLEDGPANTTADSTDDLIAIPHRSLDGVSLPASVKLVSNCVKNIVKRLSTIYSNRFAIVGTPLKLSTGVDSGTVLKTTSLMHDPEKECFRIIYAVADDGQLLITEINDRTGNLMANWKLNSPDSKRRILNLDMYNLNVVTALVRERHGDENEWKNVLYQIDTANLRKPPQSPSKNPNYFGIRNQQVISVPWDLMTHQSVSDGQYCLVSVSGSRKIGCIIFACRTRLKLLEMEPDEDTAQSSVLEEGITSMDTE